MPPAPGSASSAPASGRANFGQACAAQRSCAITSMTGAGAVRRAHIVHRAHRHPRGTPPPAAVTISPLRGLVGAMVGPATGPTIACVPHGDLTRTAARAKPAATTPGRGSCAIGWCERLRSQLRGFGSPAAQSGMPGVRGWLLPLAPGHLRNGGRVTSPGVEQAPRVVLAGCVEYVGVHARPDPWSDRPRPLCPHRHRGRARMVGSGPVGDEGVRGEGGLLGPVRLPGSNEKPC